MMASRLFGLMALVAVLALGTVSLISAEAASASASAPSVLQTPLLRTHRTVAHPGWLSLAASSSATMSPLETISLSFVLSVPAAEVSALERRLLEVSDPTNPKYGQYATKEEMQAIGRPSAEIKAAWEAWCQSTVTASTGGSWTWNSAGTTMRLRLPASSMEQLLGSRLHAYSHRTSGMRHVRVGAGEDSSELLRRGLLPQQLRDSVSHLAGPTEFPFQVEMMANRANVKSNTPKLSGKQHNVLEAAPVAAPLKTQAAAPTAMLGVDQHAIDQVMEWVTISADDLMVRTILMLACDTPMSGGKNWTYPTMVTASPLVFACTKNGAAIPYFSTILTLRQTSSIDGKTYVLPVTKYALGVTSTGLGGLQLGVPLSTNYDEYTLTVLYRYKSADGITIRQTSFDYPFSFCGATRVQSKTVQQLYKVPDSLTTGVTKAIRAQETMSVFALGLGSPNAGYYDINDIDDYYIGNRMARDNTKHVSYTDGSTPTDKNNAKDPDRETTLDISVATGVNAGVDLRVLHLSSGSTDAAFDTLLEMAIDDDSIHVLSISYGIWEQHLTDSIANTNLNFIKLGALGKSVFVSSGDTGSFFPGQSEDTCGQFQPSFPASSPWVTAVGGTMLHRSTTDDCPTEVAATLEYGAIITTGGGFSSLASQPQPSYQAAAVAEWVANPSCGRPTTLAYNTSLRAYPDISLIAHSYDIYFQAGDTHEPESVDGTSASAPVLAGIISSYNLVLLSKGKAVLGFLNPRLYSAYAADRRAFNNITLGSTKCLAAGAGCCSEGFTACSGFNPVTGLGSPNFDILGPILLGTAAADLATTVSNNYISDCPNYAALPAVVWPNKSSKRKTGLAVGMALLAVAIVALLIYFCMRAYHKRRFAHAGGLVPVAPGFHLGRAQPAQPDAPHDWGQGQRLGAGEPAPNANDLRAPLQQDPRDSEL